MTIEEKGAESAESTDTAASESAPETPSEDASVDFPLDDSTPVDFENLGSPEDLDEIEILDASAPADTPEPPKGEAAAEEPPIPPVEGATEAAETLPEEDPKSQPKGAQETEPQEASVQESSPSEQPVGFMEQLEQNRSVLIEQLAAERFALNAEEEEALELDALTAVPKLLARTYYEAVTSALKHIQNTVPALILQHAEATKVHTTIENQFFKSFDALDPTVHGKDIVMFANSFKASNPQLSQEELFNLVGAAVMAKNGISAQPPQPVNPTPPKQQPFVPANSGASVRLEPEPPNEFAGLASGVDFDD